MLVASLAILAGFILLVWSADRFVEGAAATAKYAGMPSLLIGMVIVGFGTSAPEMVVSAMAAIDGNPDLALGNALGSNIVNTGLILGLTAIITPILVQSKIVRKEIPLLLLISSALGYFLWDGSLTRFESVLLLVGFFTLIGWSIYSAMRGKGDKLESEMDQELVEHEMPIKKAIFWLVIGLILLIVSSRVLVWGAVSIAEALGVSDLIIGLTIVALGTSLPELAASIIAVRKGEHDIAIGNIFGSNLFNILLVMTAAGIISPIALSSDVFTRDYIALAAMTLLLVAVVAFALLRGRKNPSGAFVSRLIGVILLSAYFSYYIVLWPSMLVS